MAEAGIRLDKWLWHARVTRTRTLARKLVEAGKIRLNRVKVHAPSQPVHVGDVLTMVLPRKVLVYEVTALADRRGSFTEAQKLYTDLGTPASPAEGTGTETVDPARPARPDARERRAARLLRGKSA